jgi:hypothetical protein
MKGYDQFFNFVPINGITTVTLILLSENVDKR